MKSASWSLWCLAACFPAFYFAFLTSTPHTTAPPTMTPPPGAQVQGSGSKPDPKGATPEKELDVQATLVAMQRQFDQRGTDITDLLD